MAGELTITITGIDELRRTTQRITQGMQDAPRTAVLIGSIKLQAAVIRRVSSRTKGKDRERLHVRTGALRAAAVAGRLPPEHVGGNAWQARVGFAHGLSDVYAIVHEGPDGRDGTTIRPKRGRILAIPVGDSLTRGGDVRQQGPRAYTGGFWHRSKKGNLVFGLPGEAPLFFGATSVFIPARRPLRKSLEEIRPLMPTILSEEVAKVIRGH